MKPSCPLLLACSALAGLVSHALAQSYSMDWHTMAGGGGASAGGAFWLNGSVGQPAAAPALTGANFSLTGGFWSMAQAADAPSLKVILTNGNRIVIVWPSPSTGFALQQSAGLASPGWSAPSESVTDNGTNKFIIVNPPTGHRFYRLSRP